MEPICKNCIRWDKNKGWMRPWSRECMGDDPNHTCKDFRIDTLTKPQNYEPSKI